MRENVEAVGVAIVLALIIRHFSLEAFEIPTGSMAPGLNGVHIESSCPNCATVSNVGIHTDSESGRPRVGYQNHSFYAGPCPSCGVDIEGLVDAELRVDCGKCGPVAVDASKVQRKPSAAFDAWCPECGLVYTEIFQPKDVRAGHKILVNKFVRHLREPRRWEVIVFKFNRTRNYIKRLIGLPGEDVQIIDGDIWIDSEIERKPEWAQDALWFPLHDSARVEQGMVPVAWTSTDAEAWHVPAPSDEDREFRFNAKGSPSRIAYQREIHNQYAYNAAAAPDELHRLDGRALRMVDRGGVPELWRDWLIRDVRIDALVTVDDGAGSIRLEIDNGPLRYQVSIPVGKGRTEGAVVELDHQHTPDQVTLDTYEVEPLDIAREYELDFYLADRALTLRIDGEIVGQTLLETDDPRHRVPPRSEARLGLTVDGITGRVARLQLYRDIHYTRGGQQFEYATRGPFPVPEDGYFAMGDNSPSSQDSRAWAIVPKENLLGQAFWIFWPALPWDFQMGFIR